ncbi:MAG: accessory Sec system protein Asp3 [Micrococcales bacterium]|nr:accessory Sec system protein Asp3 [Micrococcales bacterium]MCL2666251.1 accessory Sec system protein Asp3 [Micrococcales bacterium]
MTTNEVTTVRWGCPDSQMSLYGTALVLAASGEVALVNRLMPAGTTMQEWYSSTDYQAVRESPVLPLLHGGMTYRVVADATSVPAGTFFFEVRFFDRFDTLLSAVVLYPPEHSFGYPPDSHHYTIRLVNAGCDELRFTSLTLLEVEPHGQE